MWHGDVVYSAQVFVEHGIRLGAILGTESLRTPRFRTAMAKLRIDAGDLELAIAANEGEWVLDLQTGDVLTTEWARDAARGLDPEKDVWDPDNELLGDDDEDLDPERFRRIDPVGSHEGFRWMERFAESQADDFVRGRLLDALERRRPFRGFKDALLAFPAVREAWFQYEAIRLRQEALDWLEVEGIDAELVDRHLPGAPPAAAPGARKENRSAEDP